MFVTTVKVQRAEGVVFATEAAKLTPENGKSEQLVYYPGPIS